MRIAPVLAVACAALALYVSRGVLDQIATPAGWVRVALLPPWPAVGGFLAVGLLGLLWLDRRAVPRASATAVRPPLGPALLPAFGLLLLLVPYLPYVADALPALQMLAGPLRAVVWLAAIAQLVWVLWQLRLLTAEWLQRASLAQLAVAIGVGTALVTGAAALRFGGTVLYPAGDEPHYLVIAQSLWRDGDLKIENNHARGDYREYFPRDLEPHYLTRGADGEIYSIHPVGMPVLMAPVYAAGGYPAVVSAFVLMAALASALVWWTIAQQTGSAGAATFAWAAVVGTSPFLFNAFAVYPEIPAALAVAAGWWLLRLTPGRDDWWRWAAIGVGAAMLPWFSTKYAPLSAALVLVALGRIGAGATTGSAAPAGGSAAGALRSRAVSAAALVVPYGVSLLAWFSFFYAIWGSPWPQAPYGAMVQTSIKNLVFGAPGLLFDQEYGLLPYAPVYVLAATGLWAMWRNGGDERRSAIEIALLFGALLGTVGAFRIWWGGSAPPGRPLTSCLLLLAIPIARAFHKAPAGSARRAAHHLLLWTGVGLAGILFFAQQGLLTANGRDGTSALLEYLSPRWPAWTLAPSFIHHEAGTALVHTSLWLLLAAAAAIVLARVRVAHAGAASLAAMSVLAAALLAAMLVMPRLPFEPAWPSLDVRARARLPLLDAFDTTTRPVAIEYAPLHPQPVTDVVARASLEVTPGLRRDAQPVRVLHNGRFSLPAGTYSIEVDWNGMRDGDTIALQLGRTGDPWARWRVDPRPGERWSQQVTLPLDIGFVGLRGSPELERVIERIRIVPQSVLDVSSRSRAGEVIAASRFGDVSFFYHDRYAFPEGRGFWIWGGRQTRVSVYREQSDRPLVLRVHSGPVANRLRLSASGWRQTVTLAPEQPQAIELPGGRGALLTLDLAAASAWVPRERDPQSTDQRPLGVWVEVSP